MPEEAIPRALFYVAFLFLLCLASTFPWWAAANVAHAEYRRLLHALACSMRIFCYSICLFCLVVAWKSLSLPPRDPRSDLLGYLHVGGTLWITVPSAWRSFRAKGARLALLVGAGWALNGALLLLGGLASPAFRRLVAEMPRVL